MTTISYFTFGNIGAAPICAVFLSDGSISQVNTQTTTVTTIAPAGTILDPTQQMGVSQWGSQYLLMVAPQTNGYFIWDGTVLYNAGTIGPLVDITNSGDGYTGNPSTIQAIAGTSSSPITGSATFSPTLTSAGNISQITVTSAGSGLSATDNTIYLAFAGGGGPTSAIAYASVVGGRVTNVSILNAGSGYTSFASVEFFGGGGVGATATVTASGGVSAVTIATAGEGYTRPPTLVFTDPNSAVVQATVPAMPFGLQGTSIETFTNRVWIGNGAAPSTPPELNLITFGAPGNPANFNLADGGGSFLSTDSFLRVGFHGLKQSNGFLYLVGDSSVNYISGVQTGGSPTTTTFSNQNVDPQVGSPWPNTVQVYSRAVVFANTYGVHALYGGAVQKVSTALDGIYTSVAPSTGDPPKYGTLVPSSAVAIIFGIHVYMLLLPIIDPTTNMQRNALLMWDGNKWWTASQSVSLTQIASQEINSVLTAYGTDGTEIFPLFQTPSNAITKTVQSKLWDNPHYLMEKRMQLLWGLFQSNSNEAVGFTVSIDTENGTESQSFTSVFAARWTATGGLPVQWVNNVSSPVTWQTTGLARFGPQRFYNSNGFLVGLTLATTSLDYTLLSLAASGQQYRDPM